MPRILIGVLVASLLITVGIFFYTRIQKSSLPPEPTTDTVVLINENGSVVGTQVYTETAVQQTASATAPAVLTTAAPVTETPAPQGETLPGESAAAQEAPSVPGTTAEVLNAFNAATLKAQSAGFVKTKTSTLNNYDIQGESLDTLKKLASSAFDSIAKECISGTLNCGTESFTATPGTGAQYLTASSLSEFDVKSAAAVPNGGSYTVTINVNDSVNPGTGSTAIEKLTKDFLTIADLQVYGPDNNLTVGKVDANIINAVVTAVIDTATGNLTSMKLDYVYSGSLSECSYKLAIKSFGGLSGTGDMNVSVSYDNFTY